MTDILFYHLQSRPLEAVLPQLVAKSLEKAWRVVIQAVTRERLAALDERLWTFDEASFLPHATDEDGDPSAQPVLLTTGSGNSNQAAIRFLTEGAPIPEDAQSYERIVLLFDGNDPDAVTAAREAWRGVKARGFEATYWRQNDAGRWEKQA
ncbi:MAG: DNA polymerase III subunit chi [Hyphomicrobiales bacterium]